MAAFQVCLQVWLATSLLADGLAVAGQVRAIFKYSWLHFCHFLSLLDTIIYTKGTFHCLNSFIYMLKFVGFFSFQAILASSFAKKDYERSTSAAARVLQVLYFISERPKSF